MPSQPKTSLWKGPLETGISFSLLSKFLVCRERFRLQAVEGLVRDEGFDHSMEYGSLWHAGEEWLTSGKNYRDGINDYASNLQLRYPSQIDDINRWAAICKMQFPIYLNHYNRDRETKRFKYFMSEKAFKIPYKLPSGNTVLLRGKVDAGLTIGKDRYIQENKTKGTIDEEAITKTIHKNLQAMIYFVAYNEGIRIPGSVFYGLEPVNHILYNVIRRPLSDRFAIRQKKTETLKNFLERVAAKIKEDENHHFKRMRIRISPAHVLFFKNRILNPILEQLCAWWQSIERHPFNPWTTESYVGHPDHTVFENNPLHWETPAGIYNSMFGGFRGDYFDYLATGSLIGLERVNNLFPELTEPSQPKRHPRPKRKV